jgi:hypothetical protein
MSIAATPGSIYQLNSGKILLGFSPESVEMITNIKV